MAIWGHVLKVSNPFQTETIMVKARSTGTNYENASYTLRVERIMPGGVPFDGGTTNVFDVDPVHGAYFYVDVPAEALGWDVRISNVTSGSPRMVIGVDPSRRPSGLRSPSRRGSGVVLATMP